jgi:hypothetical protein
MKKIYLILLLVIITSVTRALDRNELKITKDFNSVSYIAFYEPDTSSNFKKEYGVGFEMGEVDNKNLTRKYISPLISMNVNGKLRADLKIYSGANVGYIQYLDNNDTENKVNLKVFLGLTYFDKIDVQISSSTTKLLNAGFGIRLGK